MASPAQLIANRQNAALSTGPTTAEGNTPPAETRPVTASPDPKSSIPGEDAGAYEELRQNFTKRIIRWTMPSACSLIKSRRTDGA